MRKQAYFFAASPAPVTTASNYSLSLATPADIETIREHTADLFGDIEKHVSNQELYVTTASGHRVGFGILNKNRLMKNVASIGMFVMPESRQKGVGTHTLRLLIDKSLKQGLRPVAGCWYYNHASKKTLERAGMFTQTRLLKIDF